MSTTDEIRKMIVDVVEGTSATDIIDEAIDEYLLARNVFKYKTKMDIGKSLEKYFNDWNVARSTPTYFNANTKNSVGTFAFAIRYVASGLEISMMWPKNLGNIKLDGKTFTGTQKDGSNHYTVVFPIKPGTTFNGTSKIKSMAKSFSKLTNKTAKKTLATDIYNQ
jgi:hypothetical protein